MKTPRSIGLASALALTLSGAGTALAGTASIGLGGGSLAGDGGATLSIGGLILPNASAPRASITFILPRDYVTNTPVSLVGYFHTSATNCGAVLVTNFVLQRRPGVAVDGDTGVFVPKNGSPVIDAPDTGAIPTQKTWVLSPGGSIKSMKKGDQFAIVLVRNPTDPDDTCEADLYLEAVDIRYETP